MPPQRGEIQIKRLTDRPHGDAAQELLVDLLRILVRTNYTPEALLITASLILANNNRARPLGGFALASTMARACRKSPSAQSVGSSSE